MRFYLFVPLVFGLSCFELFSFDVVFFGKSNLRSYSHMYCIEA